LTQSADQRAFDLFVNLPDYFGRYPEAVAEINAAGGGFN